MLLFFILLIQNKKVFVHNLRAYANLVPTPKVNPPLSSAYGSTKLAILRFTEYINQDHGEGKDGMLAIAAHPGGVKTELATNMPEVYHHYLVDTPELAGDTFVWLGSERRDWLSGRYVSACWDMEELSERREEILKSDLLKVRLAVNIFSSQ